MASTADQNDVRSRRSSPVQKTGDESPGGRKKFSNPHTWPVSAKIAKTSGGKGEPTQDGTIGLGHQPTQANAGDRCGGGVQAASPDDLYGISVDRGEAARTAAVVLSRRLWQPREEFSITNCASFSGTLVCSQTH